MDTNITQNSNVEMKNTDSSNYKMLSASKAAEQIITGMEKDKFKRSLSNKSSKEDVP